MTEAIVLRVAARYAREFGSPEALRDYLHEHPQADKSKHTVVKDHGEHKDEGHGDEHEAPKKSWKERLKGLSEKATSLVKNAPKAVHQFIEDDSFRRKTLMDAHKSLMEAPEKLAKNALKTVKHEIREYKEAGQGIAALMKGQKMNDHQKKALKAVATHMAIGIAAAALTTSGPLAAAGMVGKGLAKNLAMKAVSNMLGKAHLLEELGHIGHGVKHILEKLAAEKKEPDTDTVLMNLVAAAVAKELEDYSDADLKKGLEAATEEKDDEGESKKAAERVASAWKRALDESDAGHALEEALQIHTRLRKWINLFQGTLRGAEQDSEGLPDGWVWQNRFLKFFQAYDALEAQLRKVDAQLDEAIQDIDDPTVSSGFLMAREATGEPPTKARVSNAIGDFQFFDNPHTGREDIAYEANTLQDWAMAFERWVADSTRVLQSEIRKIR